MADDITEFFIQSVRNKPCLYDKKHDGYTDTRLRALMWQQVATECGIESADTARMRWRNLKDCYMKHLRATRPNSNMPLKWARTYTKWRWSSQMAFLQPYLGKRDSNSADNSGYNEFFAQSQNTEYADDKLDPTLVLKRRFEEFERRDDVYHLFLSYAETFRKFSPKRQALLKVDLAQLFAAAEMEQYQEEQCADTTDSSEKTLVKSESASSET